MRKLGATALLTALVACQGLQSCGRASLQSDATGASNGIDINPLSAALRAKQSIQLTATSASLANTSLVWSVEEGTAGGTVTTSGVYTAPPTAGTYHVVVSSAVDSSVSARASLVVSLPAPASGTTWYVSHSGSDTTGDGSSSKPWKTIAYAQARLTPGDTLQIRGAANDSGDALWNEGLRWNLETGTTVNPYGTDENHRITIRAFPGETVRLQGTVAWGSSIVHADCNGPPGGIPLGGGPTPCEGGRCSSLCPSYVTIGATDSNLIIDATSAAHYGVMFEHRATITPTNAADRDITGIGPHHFRFQNVEIRNAGVNLTPAADVAAAQGVMISVGDYHEFLNVNLHDNGASTTNHDHAVYLCGKRNTFSGGEIHHNMQGIQVWSNFNGVDNADNVFENISFHDNGRNSVSGRAVSGSATMAAGISINCGTGNIVRNNAFTGNYQEGVVVGGGARNTTVTGNTMTLNNVNPESARRGYGGIAVQNQQTQCGYSMPSVHEDGTSRQHGAEGTTVTLNTLSGNVGGNMLRDAQSQMQIYNDAPTTQCDGSCPGNNVIGP